MLCFIKKIAYREGGFFILEEEGFINQQTRLVGLCPAQAANYF